MAPKPKSLPLHQVVKYDSSSWLKKTWRIHAILDRFPSQKLSIKKTLFLDVQSGRQLSNKSSYADVPSLVRVHRAVGLGLEEAVVAEDVKTQLDPEPWRHSASLSPTLETP